MKAAVVPLVLWGFAVAASAQSGSPPEVYIKAYDSRQVDTGRCAASIYPGSATELLTRLSKVAPPVDPRYRLETCRPGNPTQLFRFDVNQGGVLAQYGEREGTTYCLTVPGAQTDPLKWRVGAPVHALSCERDSTRWQWVGGRIIALDSPGQKLCLTALRSLADRLVLGECNKPETLTAWDILRLPQTTAAAPPAQGPAPIPATPPPAPAPVSEPPVRPEIQVFPPKTCAPVTHRSVSAKTWVEFRLPEGRPGAVIDIPAGAYNRWSGVCNRVWWDDLRFECSSGGAWIHTQGRWDSDWKCHGSPGSSPYVFTGNRN